VCELTLKDNTMNCIRIGQSTSYEGPGLVVIGYIASDNTYMTVLSHNDITSKCDNQAHKNSRTNFAVVNPNLRDSKMFMKTRTQPTMLYLGSCVMMRDEFSNQDILF
jgi:hypothetical protein